MTDRPFQFATKLVLSVLLTTVAACGGGGDQTPVDQPSVGQPPVAQPALFLGSTDAAAARSGLDYADGTQDADDLTGQTHTVRVTRTVTNTVTGEAKQITTDEVVTLGAPEGDLGVLKFSITLDGETLSFDVKSTRADGTTISGFERDIANAIKTEFVTTFELIAAEVLGGRQDEKTAAFFVTGFETSPDVAAINSGSATYTGNVRGINDDPSAAVGSFGGTFTLNANFADSMIDGSVALTGFDTAVGRGAVDLDLAPTAIAGNGFAGDLTVSDCSFDSCASASEIGGAFYGPGAEEVAGIIAMDITATDGGVSDQVNGSAAFVGVVD